MTIPQITIVKKDPDHLHLDGINNVTAYTLELDIPTPYTSSGIDPGTVHIGMAFINKYSQAYVYEIHIKRPDTTRLRIKYMWSLLDCIFPKSKIITIEGASYADRYRQIELQDMRCSATAWGMNDWERTEIQTVPPLTIRKTVFGSAKIKNPWEDIPDNAAAALACALYPIMKERNEK